MSPLIATVLLMAFAVALGALVMNWTIDSHNKDCDNIKVQVQQFCMQGDALRLTLRNDPAGATLQSIKLNVIEASVESTLSIKDSTLAPGQNFDRGIPAAVTAATKVELIGVVGGTNNPFTCSGQPIAVKEPVPSC
jgi:FlaG/FlaF family flagellin (archaellin)